LHNQLLDFETISKKAAGAILSVIMVVIEKATIATINPIIDQIKAFLALVIWLGSPFAVINKIPAIITIIMHNPTATGQIKLKIASKIAPTLVIVPGIAGASKAAETEVADKNKKRTKSSAIFLFINL
jgi:hypothetical protein